MLLNRILTEEKKCNKCNGFCFVWDTSFDYLQHPLFCKKYYFDVFIFILVIAFCDIQFWRSILSRNISLFLVYQTWTVLLVSTAKKVCNRNSTPSLFFYSFAFVLKHQVMSLNWFLWFTLFLASSLLTEF